MYIFSNDEMKVTGVLKVWILSFGGSNKVHYKNLPEKKDIWFGKEEKDVYHMESFGDLPSIYYYRNCNGNLPANLK